VSSAICGSCVTDVTSQRLRWGRSGVVSATNRRSIHTREHARRVGSVLGARASRFAIGDARRNWRFHWLGRCGLSLGFADGWGSLARGIRCSSFRGATRGHLVAFPLIRSGYDQANCGFCNSWRIGLAKLRQNRVILRSSADVSSYLRDDTRHSRRTIRGRAGSNPVVRCVRYICGAS